VWLLVLGSKQLGTREDLEVMDMKLVYLQAYLDSFFYIFVSSSTLLFVDNRRATEYSGNCVGAAGSRSECGIDTVCGSTRQRGFSAGGRAETISTCYECSVL